MAKKINFPTILTISRMVLAVVFFVLMLCGANICDWDTRFFERETMQPCRGEQIAFYVIALLIFIIAAITDKIDGDYARKHNQVTDLGKFLDPLADKMLVNTAFLMLAIIGAVPVWIFVLILWRDFAVDGMRMMMARNGETVAASIWGKLKTTVQMLALIVLIAEMIIGGEFLIIAGNILLYVALGLTLYSGADYIIKGWSKVIK